MSTVTRDRKTGIHNCSYHRMEIKSHNTTGCSASPRHLWKIYRDYEENNLECPVATILGHHPAFNMGACYTGAFEVDEYEVVGGYLGEPLRLTPSEVWGDDLLVPADAEVIIEGALLPGKRIVEGPFGEAPGYLGPQRLASARPTMRCARSHTARAECANRSSPRKATNRGWIFRERSLSQEGSRGRAGCDGGVQGGTPRSLQRLYLHEKDVGRRCGQGSRRGVNH